MSEKVRAHFRLIQTPCCGQHLCWVNPRLPNYCPECGKFIYSELKQIHPENILVSDPNAWVQYTGEEERHERRQVSHRNIP